MSTTDDFEARVRAEALRRLEIEQFEEAVTVEMRRLVQERELAKQPALYRDLHKHRKVELRKKCDQGLIRPSWAEIEIALSDYVIGNLSEEEFFAQVHAIDRDYPHNYVSGRGRILKSRTPSMSSSFRVPLEFQNYVEIALGKDTSPFFAKQAFDFFNSLSICRI